MIRSCFAFRLDTLRKFLIPVLRGKATKPPVRRRLKELAAEQGFAGFVEDIDVAIAGQYAYRLIGQVLFYFALKRKQPSLKPLEISRARHLQNQRDSIPTRSRVEFLEGSKPTASTGRQGERAVLPTVQGPEGHAHLRSEHTAYTSNRTQLWISD